MELFAKGDVDIGLPFISEIITQAVVEVVGPLPRDISTPTALVGFVSANSKELEAAKALLHYLSSPEAAAVYKQRGCSRVAEQSTCWRRAKEWNPKSLNLEHGTLNDGFELVASAELSEALDNINAAVGIAPFVVVPGDHPGVAVALGLSHQGIED